MAVTSVDVVESSADKGSAESALQNWIDTTTFSTVHHVAPIYGHPNRIALAIFYE